MILLNHSSHSSITELLRYVGGGAINWAFAKELRLAGKNDYQEMHEALLQAAADSPGHMVNGIDVPTAEASQINCSWAKMTFLQRF